MTAPTPTLNIDVTGLPAPQGSKDAYPRKHPNGQISVNLVESAGARVRTWRQDVALAARLTLDALVPGQWEPSKADALEVIVTFYLPRPRGHFGSGRNAGILRPSAPTWPTVKPDVDKLERAVLDALTTAGAYRDDSQVVMLHSHKAYADGRPAGASITVNNLDLLVNDEPEEARVRSCANCGHDEDKHNRLGYCSVRTPDVVRTTYVSCPCPRWEVSLG